MWRLQNKHVRSLRGRDEEEGVVVVVVCVGGNNAKWEITDGCLLCEGAAACFQAHFRVFSPFYPKE